MKKFECGMVTATPGASDILGEEGVIVRRLLAVHKSIGNEGVLGQIMSRHHVDGLEIWAVTELEARHTTFLLPAEYLDRAVIQAAVQ